MRPVRFPIILLCLLCTAVLPLSAQKKKTEDRGHWALVTGKTFVDGTKGNGEKAGIVSASSSSADFNILHFVAAHKDYDGSYSTEQQEGATVIHLGGTTKAEQRNIHRLTFKWSTPPQYVKVGEEDMIALDMDVLYDGKAFSVEALQADLPSDPRVRLAAPQDDFSFSLDVDVSPEIVAKRVSLDFNLIKDILSKSSSPDDVDKYMDRAIRGHEKDIQEASRALMGDYDGDSGWQASGRNTAHARLACDQSWDQRMPLTQGAYMLLTVTVKVGKNPSPIIPGGKYELLGTVTRIYLYQCFPEGGDVEVEIRGDDEGVWGENGEDGGESEGTTLPPWVVPGVITVIGVDGVRRVIKRRRKKKQEGKDDGQEEEEEKEEEQKKPSSYKMILYKEFGSTLMAGDDPKMVGARIEEITADRRHIDRRDLSEKIEITEGDNIKIVEKGMSGKYRCAKVRVDRLPAKGPNEGVIYFTFRAPAGALTNKVIFNLEDGSVEFFQENLTTPARCKKEFKLPFVVHGASQDAKVSVSVTSPEFSVRVDKGEVKGLWYACIKEDKTDLRKKEDKAGSYTIHHIQVRSVEPDGHTIEGSLPLFRFVMGLVFTTSPFVGCYAEEYDPKKHPEHLRVTYNGKSYAPAVTEATYSFLTWNEEENCLLRLVPGRESTVFSVQPLPAEQDGKVTDYLSKETREMTDEELINKLGLQLLVKEVYEDGSSRCLIHPSALLDAPARRKVRLHMETTWEGEKYEANQDVWLTSQPLRGEMSTDQMRQFSKEDEKITDQLWRISDFITGRDLLKRIGPVYRLAQMLLDAYDIKFGYDPGLVYLVRSTYLRFISGATLGANADAEPVEDLGLAAELLQCLSKTSQQAEAWLEDHGGVWTRLGIGIVSLGWSEAALTGLKVADEMMGAVNNPHHPGGVWEAFVAGAKVVTINYVTEKVWVASGTAVGAAVAAYHPELAATAMKVAAQAEGAVKGKLGFFAKDLSTLAKDIKKYATDSVGKRMGSRLRSTRSMQKSMSQSADDLIREWRQTSKWTPDELAEDAAFRASSMDGLRKVKDFERAYFDYRRYKTPEAEATFKRYLYEIQADKTAQKQLALYNGDWAQNLRSEYYRVMKDDYYHIDKDAVKNAVKRLREMGEDVSEDDLFVFNATNSNQEALESGLAITRDRDSTIMRTRKPTKANPHPLPEEIPQDIAEAAYGEAYTKHTGLTMEQGDQAIVQKGSKEMIGSGEKDLKRAFKEGHFGEQFDDLDGVAGAFEHKPEAWFEAGARARAAGNIPTALSKEEEGLRQAIKLYFDSAEPRGTYRGSLEKLTDTEKKLFYVMKKIEVKTQDPMSLSVTDFKKICKEKFGMDMTQIPAKLKEIVYKLES